MSSVTHKNMHERGDPEYEPYIALLDDAMNDLWSEGINGIVISAATRDEWEVLWGLFQQAKMPEYRDYRGRQAPVKEKWPTNDYAIAFGFAHDTDDPTRPIISEFGWCRVPWYHENRPFKHYGFMTFSEVFDKKSWVFNPDFSSFDSMF